MSFTRLCIAAFCFMNSALCTQAGSGSVRGNEKYDSRLGVVEFYPKGSPLEFPAISLYNLEPLELKFDLFTTEDEQLYYSVELCDYDWRPASLDLMEYVEGFPENTFEAYSLSITTTVDYSHYKLTIPNEDVRFLKSGNYILHIYRNGDISQKVLSRRFIVYEPAVEIDMVLDEFQSASYLDRQDIKVTIKPTSISKNQLVGNIHLAVLQNGNWNSLKTFDSYNSDGNNNLLFNTNGGIVFNGINEYRSFDIKSLKFISSRIDYIEYKAPNYHVYLKPDRLRGYKDYLFSGDLNGSYYIWNQETHDDDLLDADYVFVHFRFASDYPFAADVYIEGNICNWEYTDNYMEFNTETGEYEKTLFLKQGIYSYRYVTKEHNRTVVEGDVTEGNYYQTGNEYKAFLYYRALGELNDRVVGYGKLNTGAEIQEYDKEQKLNPIQQILKEIAPR